MVIWRDLNFLQLSFQRVLCDLRSPALAWVYQTKVLTEKYVSEQRKVIQNLKTTAHYLHGFTDTFINNAKVLNKRVLTAWRLGKRSKLAAHFDGVSFGLVWNVLWFTSKDPL